MWGIAVGVISGWSNWYNDHQLVSVMVRYLHLSAIVFGGGGGLWADWRIVRAMRGGPAEKESALKLLSRAHPYVVPWIVILGITGALMTAADSATFLASRVFWTKISLVILLVSNGILMLLLEARARQYGIANIWPKLLAISFISMFLWQATLFAGTLLTVAA